MLATSPLATSPLAIVSAMHDELRALTPLVAGARTVRVAGRDFVCGAVHGRPVVLALSGIGKVAAATTAALLLHSFDAHALIFTGVAGGLAEGVAVGDVVVAQQLVQHDLDVSPLFPRYVVPSSGRSHFDADAALSEGLAAAAASCLAHAGERLGAAALARFGIGIGNGNGNGHGHGHGKDPHDHGDGARPARLHRGLVVSGDRFVSSQAQSDTLRAALPAALAVEMEGAAVAQVCHEFGRPFAVLRTISDRADDAAHVDFTAFIAEVASVYTREIVGTWLMRHAAPSPNH